LPELCRHGRKICSECVVVTDAAKRAHDIVRAYVTFVPWDQRVNSWVAIRLSDGGSDGTLYDSKQAAVRHQVHEMHCAYFSFRNAPQGFSSPLDAQLYLDYHRAAYDAGFRLPDPDDAGGGPDLMIPTALDEMLAQRSRLIRGRG
jgi:hypothetical protein